MRHFRTLFRACAVTVVSLFALASIGCVDGVTASSTVDATPAAKSKRPWRILYYGWDDTGLADAIAADVSEIVAANVPPAAAHTIVVRETVLTAGSFELIRDGSPDSVVIDTPGTFSLYDAQSIVTLHREIATDFPSDNELVIVAAYGHGWRGVGADDAGIDRTLSPDDLSLLLGGSSPTDVPPVVVLDVGVASTAELLIPSSTDTAVVVAGRGTSAPAGLNLKRLGQIDWRPSGNGGSSSPTKADLVDHILTMFHDAGDAAAVAVTPVDAASIADTIATIADEIDDRLVSQDRQDAMQEAYLDAALVPLVPGDAYVEVAGLCNYLGLPAPEVNGSVLLHLVRLDEIGTPVGHDLEYRTESNACELSEAIRTLSWAPNLVARTGALFALWYRAF